MKAYNVYSNYIDEYTVIIFAESAGKCEHAVSIKT